MLDMFPEDICKMCLVVIAQLLHDTFIYMNSDRNLDNDRNFFLENVRNIISKDIAQKLFDFVEGIHAIDLSNFPERVGAKFTSSLASLEFIKVVIHLLGLDSDFQEEVQNVKKNLLKLIGYSDFSQEIEFHEPCKSLVIPEIICSNCVYTRDIDLCRDPMLSHSI